MQDLETNTMCCILKAIEKFLLNCIPKRLPVIIAMILP